jgi:DivIVA domain-containing protein
MPDQSSAASEHALIQEITVPLETLPDDPLALVEADFPTAMRGYDRHAVDDYVEQVSRLVAELHATRSPEAAVRRALERVGEQISGILQRAHETAESITAQSRSDAEDRLESARREAASIIEAAEHRVRELDADTDRLWTERQGIVADAEALSERLRTIAAEAAERLPGEEPRGTLAVAAGEPALPETIADVPRDVDPDPAPEPDPAFEFEPVPEPEDPSAFELGDRSAAGEDPELPEIERTLRYRPGPEPEAEIGRVEPRPRRLTDQVGDRDPHAGDGDLEDSTRIIPPASDAAQHRREP